MKKRTIQVAGDAVIDIFKFPRMAQSGDEFPAWKRLPGFSKQEPPHGSLSLTRGSGLGSTIGV